MKTYYKFRPRRGETVISYDRMHASGVIVDGHLEFPKEDGAPFVATLVDVTGLVIYFTISALFLTGKLL